MDREILFRGKRADNREWATSVCPFGVMCCGTITADFIPATVGQYTGLTDKNGVKIFEGDIIWGKSQLASKEGRFVIRWREKSCEFSAGEGKTWWPQLNQSEMSYYEVIGNIHDNPGLMEAAQP